MPDAAGPEVVAGHPTHEEVAAIMAALTAVLEASRRHAQHRGRGASLWADRSRQLTAPPAPGADAWRRSARP
jgi:acyl-CoA carboxylase epsilon subunit-like protein